MTSSDPRPSAIDSHAHLVFDSFDGDRADVLQRAADAGVVAVINVGIDLPTSRAVVELARSGPGLFAAVGVHPTSEVDEIESTLRDIETLARGSPREVVAVGEIGLDTYWKNVPLDVQRGRLARQLELARRLGLPVILHCRDALDEMIVLLEAEESLPSGVFHCFSGGPEHAERVLALGFHVSFAGNVTYPKAAGLRETARRVPLDRLLLETDSPFLAPQARRGKRNEPAFLPLTLECLAEVHDVLPRDLASATLETTLRLFSLGNRLGKEGGLGGRDPGIR